MIKVQRLGVCDYEDTWLHMKQFTANRTDNTPDELWLLEHPPVYTQGQAGKPEHILNRNAIKIIQSDRGGQVTYHGPGQLVAYILLDIRRRSLGIRTLVSHMEHLLIDTLAEYGISANTQCGAPGVYVAHKKIASIGLRVKNGRTYHGIALNVNMDLAPFADINPCGYAALEMTQMSEYHPNIGTEEVGDLLAQNFLTQFNK